MKRLMTTAAISLLLSTGAYAQDGAFLQYDYQAATDLFASDLLGARIYATENEVADTIEPGAETEWDDLGEINDMIMGTDGSVNAVILGIGGFLGLGERNVAVDMSSIRIVRDGPDATDYFLVVNANRALVEGAPAFERTVVEAPMTAATDGTAVMETDAEVVETDMAETEAEVVETDMAETEAEVVETDMAETEAEVVEETDAEVTTDTQTVVVNQTPAADATVEATDEAAPMAEETVVAGAESDRSMLTAPVIARDGFTDVTIDELTAEDLEGARVYGADDEDVGEIGSLLLGEDGTSIDRAIIDVGGFLGMGERNIAVTFDELSIVRNEDGTDLRVYIDATEEMLEAQPEYTE